MLLVRLVPYCFIFFLFLWNNEDSCRGISVWGFSLNFLLGGVSRHELRSRSREALEREKALEKSQTLAPSVLDPFPNGKALFYVTKR